MHHSSCQESVKVCRDSLQGSSEIPGRPTRQVAGLMQFYPVRSTRQVVSAGNPARLPDSVNAPLVAGFPGLFIVHVCFGTLEQPLWPPFSLDHSISQKVEAITRLIAFCISLPRSQRLEESAPRPWWPD
jgi:hypothetical protein